jgi:hypothetical protein
MKAANKGMVNDKASKYQKRGKAGYIILICTCMKEKKLLKIIAKYLKSFNVM